MSDLETLQQAIDSQANLVRKLKSEKVEKAKIDEEVAKLLELKASLKKASSEDGEDGKTKKFVLKAPKGMRDYGPSQMEIRESVLGKITTIFKRHGAQAIDTPICELKDILTGKYGEDSKLIYDLQDQGGEMLSLRYDLTVPFARYVAQNKVGSIKRYQIGKVYRRDNPVMTKGRYREFYQCDFDIAGKTDLMIADAECLKVIVEILKTVALSDFVIKVNHRSLIEGMFAVCGVPESSFKPICSSIDKLDKCSWEDVRKEMTEEKGLPGDVADKIEKYVSLNGSSEFVDQLLNSEDLLSQNSKAKDGLRDLQTLFENASALNIKDLLKFDLSLARGLDYYTGVIYEAVLTSGDTEVGSIAAGGRYDNLVGMFDPKFQIPCVGVSIGIERIFAILEQRQQEKPKNLYPTQVYVVTCGKNLVADRIKIASRLWDAGINTEFSYKRNPRALDQFQFCEERGIPVSIIVGDEELRKGGVKIRVTEGREETFVLTDELIPRIQEILEKMSN